MIIENLRRLPKRLICFERWKAKYCCSRAERMAEVLTARYPKGVPSYLACGVSIEDQQSADARLPHLLRIPGQRFIMIEPMLGAMDLAKYLVYFPQLRPRS